MGLPAYFTCPSCQGKKDYYAKTCRRCRRLKPEDYRAYPSVQDAGQKRRMHIVAAERALGKALPPAAEVHHVNGCRGDARNANLVICEDHSYHMFLHKRARVLKAGGDPNTQRVCSYCRQLRLFGEMVKQKPDHPRGPMGTACKRCVAAKVKARKLRIAS